MRNYGEFSETLNALADERAKRKELDVTLLALMAAADTIKALIAERDEARREICRLLARVSNENAKWWAKANEWDCFFKEDGK